MESRPLESTTRNVMKSTFAKLEKHLNGDVLVLFGGIDDGIENIVKDLIEDLKKDTKINHDTLYVILTTNGGVVTPIQKMELVFRHFYREVNFMVPDYAYSAGTVMCLSGDNIYMNYFSNLGPIDPQVKTKDGKFVSALGYLDKIGALITKAQNGTISNAEFIILKDFDLAELRSYEMAKELTIDLLTKWLVKYKFKNWIKHSNGTPVTMAEKNKRAEEIANKLSDNSNIWKSHGRPISMETLKNELKLQIQDIDSDVKLSNLLNSYYKCLTEYIRKNNYGHFFQTRKFL